MDGTRTVNRVGEVSHTYIWEDGKPLQEWVSGNTDVHTAGTIMYFYYDMNGRPYALQYNGNIYYYLLNAQGDVIRMLDSTGTTVASYEYDPFGNIITATGAMAEANPLRYRGYYYDRETGFYYLNSRYYDPKIGRFINADSYVSTGQGIVGYNMFAYCGNNPVNASDPSGQFLEWLWEWGREVLSLTGENMASMSGGYVSCGGAAVADGPLPFGDMLAVAGGVGITLGALGYAIYQTVTAPSISLSESEEKTKTQVINPPKPTIIYRYYASKTENLAPRRGVDYDGLSFSTRPPRPGVAAVVTSIEHVNSTGNLMAIRTGGAHVIIIPTNGTVKQWMQKGQNSIWTKTLSNIVIEWDGTY